MENYLYVVGDKYETFAITPHAITISQFEQNFEQDSVVKISPYKCLVGQGLTQNQVIRLTKTNKLIKKSFEKEEGKFVHKVRTENVLVAKPEKISGDEHSFISQLMIDENCELMSDHTTGCHIQGMVLVEASRQMALSVSEHYLLPELLQLNNYFTLNNIEVKFKNFLFPIDVEIHCIVSKYELIKDKRLNAQMKIDFYQNNQLAVQAIVEVSAFEKMQLVKTEQTLAKLCVVQAREKQTNLMGLDKVANF